MHQAAGQPLGHRMEIRKHVAPQYSKLTWSAKLVQACHAINLRQFLQHIHNCVHTKASSRSFPRKCLSTMPISMLHVVSQLLVATVKCCGPAWNAMVEAFFKGTGASFEVGAIQSAIPRLEVSKSSNGFTVYHKNISASLQAKD